MFKKILSHTPSAFCHTINGWVVLWWHGIVALALHWPCKCRLLVVVYLLSPVLTLFCSVPFPDTGQLLIAWGQQFQWLAVAAGWQLCW